MRMDLDWMGPMWMMGWMGMGVLLNLVLLVLAAVLVTWVVRWVWTATAPRPGREGAPGPGQDPAMQELRLRLARGEITVEEFDRLAAKLREGA